MIRNIVVPEGWFYSETFNYWQKTKGRVVCYVSPLLFGFSVQLYTRGDINVCKLEARTPDATQRGLDILTKLGEEWLSTYESGDISLINQDDYAIANPNGAWNRRTEEKRFWINT